MLIGKLNIMPLMSRSDIVRISVLTDTENYQSVRRQIHYDVIADNNDIIPVLSVHHIVSNIMSSLCLKFI